MKIIFVFVFLCCVNATITYGANGQPIMAGANDPSVLFKNHSQIQILEALAKKDFATVDQILLKVPVNQRAPKGETLLWWQANIGNLEGFEYLLSKGANPTYQVSDGPNILELCAMQENQGFIKAAVKYGANVNMISQFDRVTPIFAAILLRRYENVEFMINAKACLDVADTMGTTPVILASDQGAFDIVVLLLEKGASPTWETVQGHNLAASLAQATIENDNLMDAKLSKARAILGQAKSSGHDK